MAALLAVLGAGSLAAPLEAHDEDVIAVEARVWQDVRDEGRVFVSARAAGGYWEDLGTVAVPLDGLSASGRYRYGDVALAVPSPGAATAVEVRVWQDVRDGRKVFLSARVAGGSWADVGTVAVPLDGRSASGRYRYGDAVLLLHLPDHGPFPYDAYDLTGAVATPGSYAFFEAPDDVGPVITTYEGLRQDAAVLVIYPGEDDTLTYDPTGEVATPGTHAFFAAPDSVGPVITTYEGLRRAAAVLRIHASDADGVSRASLYGAVATGDLFEWKQAEDCFVRYRVTDAPAADGTAPYREFAVRPETYAFQSCQSGDLPSEAPPVAFTTAPDLPLDHLGGAQLTGFAVVHGIYQIVPAGWTGLTKPYEEVRPPGNSSDTPVFTESLAEARNLPYWRDPELPTGWRFDRAASGGLADPGYGYTAEYVMADGSSAFRLKGYHASARYRPEEVTRSGNGGSWETRTIAGRPAQVVYSPLGAGRNWRFPITVWVYDRATESEYKIIGFDLSLRGENIDAVIAIARSLFEGPNAP